MQLKKEENIIKGWQGQPKGMFQVLYECGFIDEKYPISMQPMVPPTQMAILWMNLFPLRNLFLLAMTL